MALLAARALAAAGRGAEAQRAATRRLPARSTSTALLAAEALGPARRAASSTPLAADAGSWRRSARGRTCAARSSSPQLDMRPESQREWVYVVRGLADDEALLLAADYARRVGPLRPRDQHRRAHDGAPRLRAALPDAVPRRSSPPRRATKRLDEALLFGIARQESRFAPDIVSSAGAVGLMQLMPATARWVAKQLDRTDYRPSQIADVAINTQFGAFYFKYWLERLDRMPALAAAAYNAGPGRAQAWRTARRSKARSGSSRSRSTRPATT